MTTVSLELITITRDRKINLQGKTTWREIFFIFIIPFKELGELVEEFDGEFPNLPAMINKFKRPKNAKVVFDNYLRVLSEESVSILDKFLYMLYVGRIKLGQTYDIDVFKELVMKEFEEQKQYDDREAELKKVTAREEKEKNIARNERLHTNVDQILTKVNELDSKVDLIIQKFTKDGGSKKKRKYRTKKR